jgi:hypothetical protein
MKFPDLLDRPTVDADIGISRVLANDRQRSSWRHMMNEGKLNRCFVSQAFASFMGRYA